jgi:hypothetical protein
MITSLIIIGTVGVLNSYTAEVNWNVADFIIAFILLSILSILIDAVLKIKATRMRLILFISTIIAFILLWLELAVGIFNSPIAGS